MIKYFLSIILFTCYTSVFAQSGWLQQNSGLTQGFLQSISFANDNTGYIVGSATNNPGVILKTTNSGSNWILLNSGVNNLHRCVFFINSLTGFIGADGTRMLKTTNGGANWTIHYGGASSYVTDIVFTDLNTGYAVGGNNGIVLKTTNQGNDWNIIYNATGGTDFFAEFFTNSLTGYVGGGSASGFNIFKTTNGGSNWVLQTLNYRVNTIFFLNNDTGFAAGGGSLGTISRTTNGGAQWVTLLTMNESLEEIYFVNNFTGYGVGSFNRIIKTTNGGFNWYDQMSCTNTAWHDVVFRNTNTGYIVGGIYILKTTTGGDLPPVSQTAAVRICRNNINKIIPDLQTIYDTINVNVPNAGRVTDVNVTIDTVTHTYDSDLAFTLRFLSTSDALITNRGSFGDNFIRTNLNDSAAIPISSGSAPFTGTYRPESPLTAFNCNFSPNGAWVLAITDRAAFDTGNLKAWCIQIQYETIVGISVEGNEIADGFSLSQNYPNPFNPVTKIKFDVPTPLNPPFSQRGEERSGGGFVTLTVYDILGREVVTLVNEQLKPGTYEVEFDGSNYPSGVYFYKLTAEHYTETRKMILIK